MPWLAVLLFCCVSLVGLAVRAADIVAPPVTNTLAREYTSLAGDWQIIVDPFDHGRLDFQSRPTQEGFFTGRVRQRPSDRIEHAWSDEHTLAVPGDWNSQDESLFFYEGAVWYRRTFDRPELAANNERVFLWFGAANRHARVWFNGTFLGEHKLGFTPFGFEITDALRDGANELVVSVDNRRQTDAVPGMMYDWWNYGGITRDVRIVTTPAAYVRTIEAGLDVSGETIELAAVIDGAVGADGVSLAVPELGLIANRLTPDEDGRVHANFDVPTTLERWEPGHAKLYDVVVRVGNDELIDRVGFRTVRTEGGDILVNGKRMFLRGICIHEEAPDREGRAHSRSDAEQLLGMARELGCNYVRLAHYPHNEHMLRVADEMGMMVWAEIPVYWTLDYGNPETLAEAEGHLAEMHARDRNRASVIIWSIGNETGHAPERTVFRTALGHFAKKIDPTRLLSAALFARMERDASGNISKMIVEDPFGAVADVLAINEYVGWYHDTPEDVTGVPVELAWNKPFVISETGAGVKQGLRGTPEEVWTEDFGVRYYEAQLSWAEWLAKDQGVLDGISPWILKDFRSPRRPLYGVQDFYNRKGLVDEHGQKKRVFDTVRSFYERWATDMGQTAP